MIYTLFNNNFVRLLELNWTKKVRKVKIGLSFAEWKN